MNALVRCSALLLLCCISLIAQSSSESAIPPIDKIIDRVQHNIESNWNSVPAFFCDEHITAKTVVKKKVVREGQVDSVLRAIRTKYEGGQNDFSESREIKLVNNRPPVSQDLSQLGLPVWSNGTFTGTLGALFGAEYRPCLDFKVGGTDKLGDTAVLLLKASVRENASSLGGRCAYDPQFHVTFWLEQNSMQVVRTQTSPFHNGRNPEGTAMTVSSEFGRIAIDGKTYWMPKRVTQELVISPKQRKVYVAEYSNYHKFTVTTNILQYDVVE